MRQIHFLEEHEERTFIRDKRREAKWQLALGCILVAVCLVPGVSIWTGPLYPFALLCGGGLVITGIVQLIWLRTLRWRLNRELTETNVG
jgi:hypothetical protein